MGLLDKATIITTPTAHSNGKLHSIKGGAVADFDVVRGSVATRVASNGLIESVATNIPRIDYTTGEGVILTEPQSTNLVTYSEDFTVGNWTKSRCTVTGNQAISPDGTLNADLMTSTDDDARLEDQVGSSGAEYTQSIYVKSAQVSDVNCQIDFAGLNTVAFTANQQWQRVETTLTDTSISPRLRLRILNSGNSIYVWGGQVEELTHATSYIPTSGAIATRLADSLTGAGDVNTFNSTEGVLYAEIRALADDLNIEGISISDGSISNRVVIFKWNSSNTIRARVSANGVNVLNQLISLTNITDFNKIAISYKLNDFKVYVNGTNVFSDTSGVTPIGLNTISFSTDGTSSAPFYGKTKTIAVFSEALTGEELTCLTTI